MRIAVLIIALCLTMLVGLQSCAVFVGGSAIGQETSAQGGAVGLLIAIFFIIGAAFALKVPFISTIVFGLAALLGLAVGATTDFKDMQIWGGVSLVLAALSYLGIRELREKRSERSI